MRDEVFDGLVSRVCAVIPSWSQLSCGEFGGNLLRVRDAVTFALP